MLTAQEELRQFIISRGLSLDDIQEEVEKMIDADIDKRLKDSTTNSPIGSQHWYNTLLGQIARDAEYMAEYPIVPADHHNERLKGIATNARILLDNYHQIPFNCY